jgi:hypothetical protein
VYLWQHTKNQQGKCNIWIFLGYGVESHCRMVCLTFFWHKMTGNMVTNFLGTMKQHFMYASNTNPVLCRPIEPFVLLPTLPVNSNFCTRWLIADLACAYLMFLRNCLWTVTKLLVWKNVLTINSCSSMLHNILHSTCCSLICTSLTFLHPVVPPFIFLTCHSTVTCTSSYCMFFWIICVYPVLFAVVFAIP